MDRDDEKKKTSQRIIDNMKNDEIIDKLLQDAQIDINKAVRVNNRLKELAEKYDLDIQTLYQYQQITDMWYARVPVDLKKSLLDILDIDATDPKFIQLVRYVLFVVAISMTRDIT